MTWYLKSGAKPEQSLAPRAAEYSKQLSSEASTAMSRGLPQPSGSKVFTMVDGDGFADPTGAVARLTTDPDEGLNSLATAMLAAELGDGQESAVPPPYSLNGVVNNTTGAPKAIEGETITAKVKRTILAQHDFTDTATIRPVVPENPSRPLTESKDLPQAVSESKTRCMYILAALGTNGDDFVVLAALKATETGSLECRPPFCTSRNSPNALMYSMKGSPVNGVGDGDGVDDNAVVPYRFTAPDGHVYEYTIVNRADVDDKKAAPAAPRGEKGVASTAAAFRLASEIGGLVPTGPIKGGANAEFVGLNSTMRSNASTGGTRSRSNTVGTWEKKGGFVPSIPPEPHVKTGEREWNMWVMGQIVSATGFVKAASRQTYVAWFIDLPTGWSPGEEDVLAAATNLGEPVNGGGWASFFGRSINAPAPVVNYGQPLEASFAVKTGAEEGDDMGWPTIYVQVGSVDSWDRHRVEGYGYARLPETVGGHEVDIQTWVPSASIRDELKSAFVGGGAGLDDISYVKAPEGFSGPFLSRFGFSSEPAGSVKIRWNLVSQDSRKVWPDGGPGERSRRADGYGDRATIPGTRSGDALAAVSAAALSSAEVAARVGAFNAAGGKGGGKKGGGASVNVQGILARAKQRKASFIAARASNRS